MKGNFEAAKAASAEDANGWYCADTIEQLAEYIGVEPAALSATVEQYNKVCAEGYDSDFAKDPHFLNAVAKAPFYAHVTTPSLGFALVTTGGFVTTNDQQVLNEDYQPSTACTLPAPTAAACTTAPTTISPASAMACALTAAISALRKQLPSSKPDRLQ